jgi:hypothetical protein
MATTANGKHEPNGHAPAAAALPLTPSADGRDATGRFAAGNKLGRANPHYRRLAQARTAFLQAVGPEQVRELAQALLQRALSGDNDAAKVVLAYAVGRPQPAADPDRADLHEFALLAAAPTKPEVLRALMDDLPLEQACSVLRESLDYCLAQGDFKKELLAEGRLPCVQKDIQAEQAAKRARGR